MARNRQKAPKKFRLYMQGKLVVLFLLVLLAFVALSVRLISIARDNGDDYKRRVLSQQSTTAINIPYKRGDILDRKGGKLAYSEKVYNLVIDAYDMNQDGGAHIDPTMNAIAKSFPEADTTEIRQYVNDYPSSRYKIFLHNLSYDEISVFQKLENREVSKEDEKAKRTISGVFFEEAYTRKYPYGSLACDIIGFESGAGGVFGLEEYYNDELSGVNGRQYGYINDDSIMERTIKPAEDGHTLVTTIDSNIQSIVEKHIKKFYDTYKDNARAGAAADNIGVIVMNPNNGEIYAMAGYPVFDLNDPTNLNGVDLTQYMVQASNETVSGGEAPAESAGASGNEASENAAAKPAAKAEYTAVGPDGQIYNMSREERTNICNRIWRNFCISDSFEPGSVMKPFTVASAIDCGGITGNESYDCGGYLQVGNFQIHCHNRLGDGVLTVKQGVAKSCNVVLMDIAFAMGKEEWLRYNRIFNFGQKTNIDLAGETAASALTFNEDMGRTDLAIASFGQGFNTTMIQMAAGFSAIINGGYYYRPHFVSEIRNSEGAVISEINPRILKQAISEKTSAQLREYLEAVVMSDRSECTGWSARPAGYTEGGKTGTAEKAKRDGINYVISFMGYVPADHPEVLCYVVIDRPNHPMQSESTRLATVLNRDIMTEVLPYLNIFPTLALTEEEMAELDESKSEFSENARSLGEEAVSENAAEGIGEAETGEEAQETTAEPAEEAQAGEEEQEQSSGVRYDPETGYPLDPATGEVLDPTTLLPVNGNASDIVNISAGETAVGE